MRGRGAPEEGVAHRLIKTIREQHAHRLGIRAKCRRDYGLSGMWASLGFVPKGESVGRGKDREILDTWWLDLGHEDLFTEAQSEALLVVTVDHSVFAGLHGAGSEQAVKESQALEAGWLADLIELAHTPQLLHAVRDVEKAEERRHQRAGLAGLRPLSPDTTAVSVRLAELVAAVRKESPGVPLAAEQRAHLRYVAETSCAGLQVLVTRDPGLAALADIAWGVARVKVVSPRWSPCMWMNCTRPRCTGQPISWAPPFPPRRSHPAAKGSWSPSSTRPTATGVPPSRSDWKRLATDGVLWHRELLRDGAGRPVALNVWAMDGRTLNVAFLRTASHPLGETLARQLLFMLKKLARERSAQAVRIADPYMSTAAKAAASSDGFIADESGFTAVLVDVCGSADAVSAVAAEIGSRLGRVMPALDPQVPPEIASMAERVWWPVKLIDSALPSFIAPIKPRWSTELFDVPAMLVPRADVLGISREHVYYRSSGHRGESVPARILWYVSKGTSGQQGKMVIGCSRLDEVIVDEPDTLFTRFEHLGVYGRADVRVAVGNSGSGKVMALRFSDTEIFPVPVTHSRLTGLARKLRLPLPLTSLSKISNALFQAVYEEGHRTT